MIGGRCSEVRFHRSGPSVTQSEYGQTTSLTEICTDSIYSARGYHQTI